MEDKNEYELIDPEDPEDKNEIIPSRKFSRSVSNTVAAGVCGGLGEYMGVEPNLLRVIFVLLSLLGGWGIAAYIFFTLVMKISPEPDEYTFDEIDDIKRSDSKTIIGSLMIMTGIYFVLAPLGLFTLFGAFALSIKYFLIVILLGFGIRYMNNGQTLFDFHKIEWKEQFYRSREDKRFMGVCGGLAYYLNIDSTLLRVMYVVSLFLTAGFSMIVYFIFAYFVSYEPEIIVYEE